MKRKALSFILGLLVLLTVFSNGVSAEDTYIEHFDESISFSYTKVNTYVYYHQINLGTQYNAELIEYMFTTFNMPSSKWQLIYFVGTDGYKYGLDLQSSGSLVFDRYSSDLLS